MGSSVKALDQIRQRTEIILQDGKLPFLLGGEHLVTLGAVQAVAQKYPDLHIIHFDAHADLRQDYLEVELSHACVLRRCWEFIGDGRIYQFGIRSGTREEFAWSKDGHTIMRKFDFAGLEQVVAQLQGKPVYFTIDLDVLDPSIFPGTGTPEAGGVGFLDLLQAIHTVCAGSNIVGCDVNELCPPYDQSGASTAVACKVVRELLLELQK
jgi:agmatinase